MGNTYSFANVQASLVGPGGSINMGNGAGNSDEGITIDPNGDKNSMTIGADGSGMHSLHADKSGTIVVRLLKTSPVNQLFMNMYNFQLTSSRLWGQNVITVTDTGGGDNTGARGVAFKRKTPMRYAKDGQICEWSFDAIAIDTILGTY